MSHTVSFPEEVRGIYLETVLSGAAGLGVYVFRAGPFLIDAGFKHARQHLLAWDGLSGAQTCLLSHHDEDHAGNAEVLAGTGLEVRAPRDVIRLLGAQDPMLPYRRIIWGTGRYGGVRPLSEGAEEVRLDDWRFVPVHTPGHTPDHYIYHEPDRGLVFSGDLYIGRAVPVAKADEDLDALLGSLQRVIELGPRAVFCGHRGRLERPVESLRAKIDWLQELIGGAKRLASEGRGVEEIRGRLLGRRQLIDWASLGEYSRRNLIERALAATSIR